MKHLLFTFLVLSLTLPASAAPKKLLALGDSLTEGYGIQQDKAYPAILEKLLRDKKYDITVINGGSSGATSASGEKRLKWYLKNKPDVMILALGANDGLRGLPTDGMSANLDKTIALAKKNSIPVIMAGMKIPLNYGADYRKKYEAVFADLAKKHSLIFIPFLLEGVGADRALNQADGIHPNEKGHEKMAQLLLPFVEKALKK